MLVGVGFEPREAAIAALLGNTIAVPSGGVGIPTVTLAQVTGIPPRTLAPAIQRLCLPFSIIMPWVIVFSVSQDKGVLTALKRTFAVWPACLLVSVVQTGLAYLMAEYVGPPTVSIVSFMVTLILLALLLTFVWHPKEVLMTQGMQDEELGHVDAFVEEEDASHHDEEEAQEAAASSVTGQAGFAANHPVKQLFTGPAELELPHVPSAPVGGGVEGAPAASTTATTQQDVRAVTGVRFRTASAEAVSVTVVNPMARTASPDFPVPGDPTAPRRAPRTSHLPGDPRTRTEFEPVRVKLTRHKSLEPDRRHPIIAHMSPHRPGMHLPSIQELANQASNTATAPTPGGTRRVFLMKRVASSIEQQDRIDSSSIGTALFPSSMDLRASSGHPSGRGRSFTQPRTPGMPATPGEEGIVRQLSTALSTRIKSFRSTPSKSEVERRGSSASTSVGSPATSSAAAAPAPLQAIEESPSASPSATTPGGSKAHGKEEHGDAHAKEAAGLKAEVAVHYDALHPPTNAEVALAWFPWVFLCIAVSVWGSPEVKGVVKPIRTGLSVATLLVPIPGLDQRVNKPDPIGHSGAPHIVAAIWTVDLLGAAGVCIYLVDIITLIVFRVPPRKALSIYITTIRRMALSFLTICVLMAFGYVLKASGQDVTLGLAAAATEKGFPFVGTWIGALGVALTGSATSTSVIFGSLQVVAAEKLGINPVLMASANMVGGTCIHPRSRMFCTYTTPHSCDPLPSLGPVAGILGHIVSTSSMVVAGVSTGMPGKGVGPIMKAVGGYALATICACAIWTTIVAFVIPGFMPVAGIAA